MTRHTIIYIPGLGDSNLSGRRKLLSLWNFRGVSIEICSMDWTIDEPWPTKLGRLQQRIDELSQQGRTVSLIGESAGAAAAVNALYTRESKLHTVFLLCGKSRFPERVAAYRYNLNPKFKDALLASHEIIPELSNEQRQKLINLHPLFDPVVPVAETKIPGVQSMTMPIIGHATSIVFANTLWSWKIVRVVRKNPKR